MNIW